MKTSGFSSNRQIWLLAGLVIVVCAFFYGFQPGLLIYREQGPVADASFLQGLYFSMITFTTLGYGDLYPAPGTLCRLVAMSEAVIGGFHLMENNNQTKKTVTYFKEQNISQIFPSHCTKFPALVAFYNEFKIKQVTTGMIFKL